MPNPRGNLAGWSDPENPDWRQEAMRRISARQRKKDRQQHHRRGYLTLYFDPPFRQMLDEAAHRRGMTLGSYARRAVAKQIATDLGIDWTEVLKHCARPTAYGVDALGGVKNGPTVDDGTGFGEW